jgi:phenylacetate-CoA ligase
MVESWAEIFQAAGVRAGDRVYFAFSFGPFIGFWLAFESAERVGCLCIPGGGLSSVARLKAMLENDVTVLCCTPAYALRLAEVAAQEGLDLARLKVRTLVVAGEPGGSIPAVRKRIAAAWNGANVFDHHGMTETGPVTYQCPAQPGVLHVIESAYYPEVVEPETGRPAPPGSEGELVLTTLGRVGMPLLRYRTGDIVKKRTAERQIQQESGNCICGRHEMALEGGIIGRTDDMVVIRGVNVYPTALDEIVRSCSDVAEYQVEVSRSKALPELGLTIETSRECTDPMALAAKIQKMLQTSLTLTVPVTVASHGTLPRFEMKSKRWVIK